MSTSTVVTEGFSTGTSLGRTWFVVTEGYGQLFVVETADSVLTLLGAISPDGKSVRGELVDSRTYAKGEITDTIGAVGEISADGVSARCKIESLVATAGGKIEALVSITGEIDALGHSSRSKVSDKPTNLGGKI